MKPNTPTSLLITASALHGTVPEPNRLPTPEKPTRDSASVTPLIRHRGVRNDRISRRSDTHYGASTVPPCLEGHSRGDSDVDAAVLRTFQEAMGGLSVRPGLDI